MFCNLLYRENSVFNKILGTRKFCLLYQISCYISCQLSIVSWEPEGHCSSKMFRWEPEGHYHCTKWMAIAPFWFSTEHHWSAITPFWLSTDAIRNKGNYFIGTGESSLLYQIFCYIRSLYIESPLYTSYPCNLQGPSHGKLLCDEELLAQSCGGLLDGVSDCFLFDPLTLLPLLPQCLLFLLLEGPGQLGDPLFFHLISGCLHPGCSSFCFLELGKVKEEVKTSKQTSERHISPKLEMNLHLM